MIVEIKKVINGGYGLATRHNGKTVLVRGALPGEIVHIAIEEQRKDLDFARVVTVENPHPGRITPPCPYYGTCGGCDMQHVNYRTQCACKQHLLIDLLQRSGATALQEQAVAVKPVIPSPRDFGYRQRIRLKIDCRRRLGFTRFGSHDIVPVDRCLLAEEQLNLCLQQLGQTPALSPLISGSDAVELHLNPLDDTVWLFLALTRPPRPADRRRAAQLCRECAAVNRVFLTGRHCALEGPFSAVGDIGTRRFGFNVSGTQPMTLFWEAGGFAQVNTEHNLNLIKLVLDMCNARESDSLLDLYCGMGNFSLPAAHHVRRVLGIENQGAAIRGGRFNAQHNHLSNITFEKSDVLTACTALVEKGARFDIIICDPPRHGMAGTAPLLSQLTDGKIIYISCDPATLCRDLADLTGAGFLLKTIQPIDMFPQTHHLETVVLLEKN